MISVKRKERIGVIECAEEFTAHLVHSFGVEFEVLPRAGIRQHIPSYCISSVCIECSERIYGVAEAFGHLIAVLIEHQTIGDDVFVCHRSFNHRVDGMQGEEPSAGLVHAFRDEVGSAWQVCVLKGVVVLRVRHSARVEPNIDEVEFAFHGFARRRNEDDRVHVRTVEVDYRRIVVGLAVIAHFVVRPWVGFHEARLDRFVDFIE